MPAFSTDMIWLLLEDGDLETLRAVVPAGFDWCTRFHPTEDRTPLQVAIVGAITVNESKFKQYIGLVTWLIENGADPQQQVPSNSTCKLSLWKNADQEGTKVEVQYAGTSAISMVVQLRKLLRQKMKDLDSSKPSFEPEIARCTNFLSLMAREIKTQREKVPVDSGVVDLWERISRNTATHDVTIETASGPVTAHRLVLTMASPVLAAMLSSTMREGCNQRIDVKDASQEGASFFLELTYTGTSCSDVDHSVALVALDLAHRWQVDHVVAMVSRALEDMLNDSNFSIIAESAVIKELPDLKMRCKTFAANSSALKKKLKDGKMPQCVLELLGKAPEPKVQPKKRKTF